MIIKTQQKEAQELAAKMCAEAGIVLSEYEKDSIEVVDEGLNDLYHTGLQIVTYINTERVCAKEIILSPFQTCPEHMHPVVDEYIGKEETFRCRWGTIYLYIPGEKTVNAHAVPPEDSEQFYTVWNEIILRPGDQFTIHPNTFHWFQAGTQGAIVSEFSTNSIDETDIFTNPYIKRITVITED